MFFADSIKDSQMRWIKHDPVFDEMYQGMVRTTDPDEQEEEIRELGKYRKELVFRVEVYSGAIMHFIIMG